MDCGAYGNRMGSRLMGRTRKLAANHGTFVEIEHRVNNAMQCVGNGTAQAPQNAKVLTGIPGLGCCACAGAVVDDAYVFAALGLQSREKSRAVVGVCADQHYMHIAGTVATPRW